MVTSRPKAGILKLRFNFAWSWLSYGSHSYLLHNKSTLFLLVQARYKKSRVCDQSLEKKEQQQINAAFVALLAEHFFRMGVTTALGPFFLGGELN